MTARPSPGDQRGELTADDDPLIAADDDRVGGTPFVPSDNTTSTAVIDALAERGFTGQFIPHPDGMIECGACGATTAAAEYTVESVRRLEGASDPDEMVAVVAAVCPRCAQAGVLVLGFGPAGSDIDADVIVGLESPPHGR